MIVSLGLVLCIGLCAGWVMKKMHLPAIIGMLLAGIIIGPYCLNLLDASILNVSSELRKIALIVILLKAGFSLNLSDLKKNGKSAVLMSFVPAVFEMIGYVIIAPMLFDMTRSEAALMGAVLAAVSPAVVVPRMVNLIETHRGTQKGIPQMILAGASCDDVFVIVMFSSFLAMAQGGSVSVTDFLDVPVSIVLGCVLGALIGYVIYRVHALLNRKQTVNHTAMAVMVLGISFLLVSLEEIIKPYIALSGLLAVTVMACTLRYLCEKDVSSSLSSAYAKIWIGAEPVLFVLVGAAVDIRYLLGAGAKAVALILLSLVFRTVGVIICLLGTELSFKERIFCIMAYLPKATVQAAIGSIPLAAGLPCGALVLSVAVMGIVITAPIGAFLIDCFAPKLLSDDSYQQQMH